MSEDLLKDFQTAPTLTFEPFPEEKSPLDETKSAAFEQMKNPQFN